VDSAGGSASRLPLEARPIVHPAFLDLATLLVKGGGRRFGMGGQNHRGSGEQESLSEVQGRSPGSGSGGRSPPEAEEFLK